MPKKDSSEPAVKTCSIEVKVITVNNKQINKSFLKQLYREPLIDEETGCLLGIPWGYIKLPLEDCKEEDHLHVIWQKDQSLKTSCVTYKPPEEQISKVKSIMLNLFIAMFLMDALKKKPEWLDNVDYKGKDYNNGKFLNIDYIKDYSWQIDCYFVNLIVDLWYKEESVNVKKTIRYRYLPFDCDEKTEIKDYKKLAIEQVEESKSHIHCYIKEKLQKSGLSEKATHNEVLQEYEKLSIKLILLKANWKKSVSTILESGQIYIP